MKTYHEMPSLTGHPSITGIMKERIAFVDYIRVIACLLVMVVHASEQFYNMGGGNRRGWPFPLSDCSHSCVVQSPRNSSR